MTRALPPQITLPNNPGRQSVKDMVSLWESKTQSPKVGKQSPSEASPKKPSVKSGVAALPVANDSFETSATTRGPVLLGRSKSDPGFRPIPRPGATGVEVDPLSLSLSSNSAPVVTGSSVVNVTPVAPTVTTVTTESNPTLGVAVSDSPNSGSTPTAAPTNTASTVANVGTGTADLAAATTTAATTTAVEESKPLNGGAQLKEAVLGKTGLWAGLKALLKGRFSEGLSNIVRALVTMPFAGVAALLDGPRKIGDIASKKGKELVLQGENQGGLTGALKSVGGGLVQAAGGLARLAQPVLGMALMAATGPVGWGIGAVLLGMFVLKEVASLVTGKTHEMQTFKAVRDVVSGAGAVAGGVVETVVNPIKARFAQQPAS